MRSNYFFVIVYLVCIRVNFYIICNIFTKFKHLNIDFDLDLKYQYYINLFLKIYIYIFIQPQ